MKREERKEGKRNEKRCAKQKERQGQGDEYLTFEMIAIGEKNCAMEKALMVVR